MKGRIFTLLLAAAMMLSAGGCSEKKGDKEEKKSTEQQMMEDDQTVTKNGYIVVGNRDYFPAEFDDIRVVKNGSEEGTYEVFNVYGDELFQVTSEEYPVFTEGVAAVCVGGLWGFIDKDGKTISEPKFTAAGEYFGGSCPVTFNGEELFIDKAGNVTEDKRYEGMSVTLEELKNTIGNPKSTIYPFTGSYARFVMDAGGQVVYGYADKAGKLRVMSSATEAYDFYEGYALIVEKEDMYFINEKFERVTGNLMADGYSRQSFFIPSSENSRQYIFKDGCLAANVSNDGVSAEVKLFKLSPDLYKSE